MFRWARKALCAQKSDSRTGLLFPSPAMARGPFSRSSSAIPHLGAFFCNRFARGCGMRLRNIVNASEEQTESVMRTRCWSGANMRISETSLHRGTDGSLRLAHDGRALTRVRKRVLEPPAHTAGPAGPTSAESGTGGGGPGDPHLRSPGLHDEPARLRPCSVALPPSRLICISPSPPL